VIGFRDASQFEAISQYRNCMANTLQNSDLILFSGNKRFP